MGGRREILEAENLKSAITSESILCVQYVLMHLEMHNVSPCPRGQKGQEAEKQTKGWMLFCVFLSRGEFFLFPVFFNIDTQIQSVSVCVCWKRLETKKLSPGSSKKTAIHRKHHRCRHYPRSPQLQCCAWKCRTLWTKMAVFFEGRHTHNSEYNIELGDGGNMTCMVLNFIGWLFFFEEPGLRKTQNSIHPFVCFSASCPLCPRGHWLTVCISRCIKTYCTHRIDSEVIADLRFSASKISRLPPKILVPATLVPLPQFRDVICVALLPCSCNAHATHMQHTCNTHATRHATRAFSLEISRKSARGDENLHFEYCWLANGCL